MAQLDDRDPTVSGGGTPVPSRGAVVAGQRLGRYVVTEKIGQGGMGTVWCAWDPELDREVALKVLRTDYDDPVYHARVVREAQSLARLAHPNVVPVYDVGIDFGLLWVAMQRVRGTTLTEWLAKPHPWREIVAVFVQAAYGLSAAHQAGLVHRDFKPGNAMITDGDGRVMVLDFGLAWAPGVEGARTTAAHAAESASEDVTAPVRKQSASGGGRDPLAYTLTASDAVVGTPPYMAPEQHTTRDVDARTDQYALCVSMYEGLFGRRPFRGDIPVMLAAKAEGAPARPSNLPQLPERLWKVIARGMEPDPARRWPDLPTMIGAIERAMIQPRRAPWIVAAGAFVIGGVAAAMPASAPPDPCTNAGASLQAVWNESRKAELATAFSGSERSGAREAAARVSAQLDTAVAGWLAQARSACTATYEDPMSGPVPTLACVDRAALAIDAALEVLQSPDDARIARAARMVESVVERHRCGEVTHDAPPMDAELARTFERGRALMAAGALPEVREVGLTMMREANERADPAALARALLLVGGASLDMGDWEEAQARYTDALWTATASGDDEAITTASTKLIELCVYRYDPECAKPWIRNAEAGLARLGDRGALQRTELDLALGDVALREGDEAGALALYQRALDGRIAHGGEEQMFVAVVMSAIATAHARAGRHEQALALAQRRSELEAKIFGENDSGRASGLELIAGSLNALGRNDESRAVLERGLALLDAAYGERSRHAIRMRGNLVMVLTDAGELDDALALAQKVVAAKRELFGPSDVQVAMALHNEGRIFAMKGDPAAACRDFHEALELWERALGPEHIDLAHPLAGLARCERELGHARVAYDFGTRAEQLRTQFGRPEDPELTADIAAAKREL
ncbi:MAG TPA: serine/threonine-protein kinase [Nannocystaceae bacterium]|nr:serine/threonine-protein kinase [Nannocystaceae bacterium]